ncbi:hypothetical protein [Hydrogenophaga sp. BPS33]|uniref:hypothetical protein n=1 Tax=Hydrogenophaga sp. BPS33 TaxID=2651974 RepID=UPI00131F730D|nr:hypothetical protein [Hydrogenophaga sp. BPS33]QHE86185.1 hypothetical protein F9K07_15370 [Hydrogenophaga sp. BPS33]
MTLNIKPSLPSVTSTPSTPSSAPDAPKASTLEVAKAVATFRQIEVQEEALVQQINQGDLWRLELKRICRTLAGDLSNYSRTDVEEMAKEALNIESKLEALNNPERARTDGPRF